MLEAHSMIVWHCRAPSEESLATCPVFFANMSLQDPLKIRREAMGKGRGKKGKRRKETKAETDSN